MKLIQLRYFCSIVENRGFISASRELHIAQPALSRQILDLEALLGTDLLIRGPGGTRVTDAGRRFYKHAKSILDQVEYAKIDVGSTDGQLVGEVSIVLPVGFSGMLAATIIGRVEAIYPEIQINILDSLGYEASQMIEAGKVDFGILPNVGRSQDLTYDPVLTEDLFLFSKNLTGDPDRSDIALAELVKYQLVMPNRKVHVRRALEDALAETGHKLNVRYEQQSLLTIRSLITSGIGATVLNWPAMADIVRTGDLDARRIVSPKLSRNISLAAPVIRPLSPASSAVYDLVREIFINEVQNGNWKGEVIQTEERRETS